MDHCKGIYLCYVLFVYKPKLHKKVFPSEDGFGTVDMVDENINEYDMNNAKFMKTLRINGQNPSEFAIAELIFMPIWGNDDTKYTVCVENYLSHKYGIDIYTDAIIARWAFGNLIIYFIFGVLIVGLLIYGCLNAKYDIDTFGWWGEIMCWVNGVATGLLACIVGFPFCWPNCVCCGSFYCSTFCLWFFLLKYLFILYILL